MCVCSSVVAKDTFLQTYTCTQTSKLATWFLDFNVLSVAYGCLWMNYTFKICLHQFNRQVTKLQVESWITVLDTTQSTTTTTRSQMVSAHTHGHTHTHACTHTHTHTRTHTHTHSTSHMHTYPPTHTHTHTHTNTHTPTHTHTLTQHTHRDSPPHRDASSSLRGQL